MQHVENELDITLEKLTQTTTKLDEKDKAYAVAEGAALGLADCLSRVRTSWSSTAFSDLYRAASKGRPVIFCGPLGMSKTVNLNWATEVPSFS